MTTPITTEEAATARIECDALFSNLYHQVMIERPSAIYLGQVEYEMLRWVATKEMWFVPNVSKKDRAVFCGVPVFVVDAHTHIGFGHSENAKGDSQSPAKNL